MQARSWEMLRGMSSYAGETAGLSLSSSKALSEKSLIHTLVSPSSTQKLMTSGRRFPCLTFFAWMCSRTCMILMAREQKLATGREYLEPFSLRYACFKVISPGLYFEMIAISVLLGDNFQRIG